MPSLIQIIKQAAIEAVEAANPTRVMYGTVTSESPVEIKIDQKFTIPSDFIILTRNVSDYKVKINDGTYREITIYNGLKSGDRVILLQEQGGQKYIVIDKIGGAQ